MKQGLLWFGVLIVVLCVAGVGWWYVFGKVGSPSENTPFSMFTLPETTESGSPSEIVSTVLPTTNQTVNGYLPLKEYTLEKVVEGLEVPWSLVPVNADTWYVTERPGRVRVIRKGELQQAPLLTLSEVSSRSEEGLMGMALDPEYAINKFIYLSYAYQSGSGLVVKVVKYTDEGTQLTEPTVLIDNIPAATNHAGSRLRFGPDKKLYITTGDATDRNLAQDMKSVAGKILRIESDGSIPGDNPDPESNIYSYGHRNPQGIDFHPVTQQLVSTEHGPSVFDGPAGGDEVNVILPGENYGWPLVSHEKTGEGLIPPLLVFTPAVAPASGVFYNSDTMPELKHSFLFGGLRGEGLFRVWFDPNDPWKTARYDRFSEVNVGRVRDVVVGLDGAIYFTTSNRDGRGQPRAGDDAIYRLRQAK